MEYQITDIDSSAGENLAAQFTMRYRLAADPDVAASYTNVTATQTIMGLIYPFFDIAAMPSGTYVLHVYLTTDGDTTGSKVTIDISGSSV